MNQGATNSVFQTTVQRSLLLLVFRSRRLVHVHMLTAVHQQRRLEFSYRYRNWASNERRQDGGIYQQDIAECHTTDSARAWFKEHQDQFIVLPCPENSPDLSSINNLWNPLDRVVRVMDPHAPKKALTRFDFESKWAWMTEKGNSSHATSSPYLTSPTVLVGERQQAPKQPKTGCFQWKADMEATQATRSALPNPPHQLQGPVGAIECKQMKSGHFGALNTYIVIRILKPDSSEKVTLCHTCIQFCHLAHQSRHLSLYAALLRESGVMAAVLTSLHRTSGCWECCKHDHFLTNDS
ncbi:transposable element Tcb1 transposase [Trichonephila clavipes]|nr:transposable element Tcb1 transposase [Trichonephila clavipes]